MGHRDIASTLLDIKTHVTALVSNPIIRTSNINAIIEWKMKEAVDIPIAIGSKLKTALQFSRGSNHEEGDSRYKSVLQSTAARDIGSVIDDKGARR